MKIGIMCHSSCGGSTRVATELAMELSRRGHRVHLFTQTVPFGYRNSTNGVILHTPGPEVENMVQDLFLDLAVDADQLDFPILYAAAKEEFLLTST